MVADLFEASFGVKPDITLFTPGRVNLIGEHTDYNGGMVLPTAIKLGLDIAFTPRADDKIRIRSDKFDELALCSLKDLANDNWSDYVTGAVIFAHKSGLLKGGADIAIKTSLPFGAGLSSSAAVIVGILKAARRLAGSDMSDTEIAVLARRVENEYIGMPCGIMDQMAVAIARPGQALALDTKSLKFKLVDLPADYHMAVIHSGVFRKLSEGRYQIRKEECDAIKAYLGRDDICLISDAELESLAALPANIQRRAKHCMTEHRRTEAGISALTSGDLKTFGSLMTQSHASMRDDFDITLPKIDNLVEDAVKLGALGARMTGGGFGGCIVACVETQNLESWSKDLTKRHSEAFFVC